MRLAYSVIIPTYGEAGVELTRGCLDSLRSSCVFPHEVIVVDDGSADEVVAALDEICELHGATLLHSEENLGFAATCNSGIEKMSSNVAILFNNDARPIGPTCDYLAEAIVAVGAGVMGCRLLYPNYTIQHAGVFYTGRYFDHIARHGSRYDPRAIAIRPRLVTGAMMAIQATVFQSIGLFDERFQCAVEDVDFCLRAIEGHMPVLYNGLIEAFHFEGATRGATPQEKAAHQTWTLREELGMQAFADKWQGFDLFQFSYERSL
ncbi:hypothetical protein DRH14_03570 [Candidatus Shapirobacteria bacterium]|nr:MAG: hypothetical protein DRH14_03570 [Candidatus Shapirobacteria bacterium]